MRRRRAAAHSKRMRGEHAHLHVCGAATSAFSIEQDENRRPQRTDGRPTRTLLIVEDREDLGRGHKADSPASLLWRGDWPASVATPLATGQDDAEFPLNSAPTAKKAAKNRAPSWPAAGEGEEPHDLSARRRRGKKWRPFTSKRGRPWPRSKNLGRHQKHLRAGGDRANSHDW